MGEKHKKKFGAVICLLIFLYVGFFCLSISCICAAGTNGLEVQYTTGQGGQNLNSSTSLPAYITYLFNFGMAVGTAAVFVSFAIAGVMYLLSPASPGLLSNAKDRVSGAISGLLILVLVYLIVTTINPQLNFFNLNKLPPETAPPIQGKSPGVYFYSDTKCSDSSNVYNKYSTTSIPDLGLLRNGTNSVSMVEDPNSLLSYVSILYDKINFQGKCQYLDPHKTCQAISSFGVASASIYTFNYTPSGNGVTFYRKPYFNKNGGYLLIPSSEIRSAGANNVYQADLSQMKFSGVGGGGCSVPEEEQDCVKYDGSGKCTQRSCPALTGGNISSIKIDGSYVVILVYASPSGNNTGPWASCQEFPTTDDASKIGPPQIKWQNIMNIGNVVPNHVIIIPTQ